MNISEFERTKPTKTYASIRSCIDKYNSYIQQLDPVMDAADAAYIQAYQEMLQDLKNIKSLFIKGE
jgi:hypothetical protein